MKKNVTLKLASAALLAGALVSCNEQLDVIAGTSTEATYQDKFAEFAANFEKEFGKPDPNHTWGFGMTPEEADAILGVTRAAGDPDPDDYTKEGIVNVNRNEWCTESNPYCLMNVYGVPGWPNDDNRYYEKSGAYTNGSYIRHETKPSQCNMPAGDVTEYEILWVSNFVHFNDMSLYEQNLHISEFYIQYVSTDDDYESEADYWAGTKKVFAKDYTDCLMDKLDSKSLGGSDTWTHINNDNAAVNRYPIQNVGSNSGRNIIFVQSAGTENFRYHASGSTEDWYNKFKLVELTWTEPKNPDWSRVPSTVSIQDALTNPALLDPNGETLTRTGYYLCFDYQEDKQDEGVHYQGDNRYDNWILKLTPGYPIQKNRWPKRLMCEDLGNTYDFDFNDAVFDLSFARNVKNSNAYDMIVVIQAAGGTMPIQVALPIGWTGGNVEIHNLLGGNPSTTPVNVVKGGAKAAPAMYRMKNVFTFDPSGLSQIKIGEDADGHDILIPNYNTSVNLLAQMAACAFTMNIYIKNGATWTSVSGYDLYKGLRDEYNDGNKGASAVPQLFNCSSDAKWTYENGHIKDAYKHFADWVQNEQGDYRLRWDEAEYFYRTETNGMPALQQHTSDEISSWKGSWDYGVKDATTWGLSSEFIDKSKCWGGNGPE